MAMLPMMTPLAGWTLHSLPHERIRLELSLVPDPEALRTGVRQSLPVEMSAAQADGLADSLRQKVPIRSWGYHPLPDDCTLVEVTPLPGPPRYIPMKDVQRLELADALTNAAQATRMGQAPTQTRN